jgi:hypothetical protein
LNSSSSSKGSDSYQSLRRSPPMCAISV